MESLLSTVIVILIFALVLVIFLPAGLERLGRGNVRRAAQAVTDLQEREREARRLELLIAPYARGRSTHFTAGAAAAREHLNALLAHLAAADATLARVSCPPVRDFLLPVLHFVLAPRDVAAIPLDTRRLARLRRQMRAADDKIAAVRAALDDLAALPNTLAVEQRDLAADLVALEDDLRAERAAGIDELADVERELARLRGLAAPGAATRSAGPPMLPDLDAQAVALETATAGVAPLRAAVAAIAEERARLDEALRRAMAHLDAAQAAKAGPDPTAPAQVRPLLRTAAALLNESAPAHRRRRDFPAARADVSAADSLVALARDLTAADGTARLLAERDDGVSLSAPIGEVRRDLADLLDRVGDLPAATGRDHRARVVALVARAADLRRRAESLATRQSEVIAALERDASAIGERLGRDWLAAQRLLRLAADDPLARQQARLATDVDAARRHPEALARLREEATTFESVLAAWVTRVQEGRRRVARLREQLPVNIDAALAAAAPWACLAEHVAFIQQRAADFETTQAHFAAAHHRRAADGLLDELEAIERDVAQRLALLSEQAERLRFLEADVAHVLSVAAAETETLLPDDPVRPKRDRVLGLIAHHNAQAHAAVRYEDASLALSRAADLANKLAL